MKGAPSRAAGATATPPTVRGATDATGSDRGGLLAAFEPASPSEDSVTALELDSSSSSNNGGDCGELTPGLVVAVVAGPSGGPGACSSFSVTLTQVGLALVLLF